MAIFAMLGRGDGDGPLSPDVCRWRDGSQSRLSHMAPGSTIKVCGGPEFEALIRRLLAG